MKYSIITVSFNSEKTIERTIKSVLTQNENDYEYIIVDGASKDSTIDIIKHNESLFEGRLRWISEPDSGIYNAMNKGISVARGEYCLFLNSGDTFYEKDTLKKVLPCLDMDFVCGNAVLKYAGGMAEWDAPQTVDVLFFMQRFSVCHQSLFIRTSMLQLRPYNESFQIVADYEQIFYEIVVNHRTYKKVDLPVCYYGCDGISSNHENADSEKREVLNEFRYLGYIEADELLDLVNRLKVGSRKYRLLLFLTKRLVSTH